MTLEEIINDDVVKNNIDVRQSHNPSFLPLLDYTPKLFGEHEVQLSFISGGATCVCDYTVNQDIIWETAFEKTIKTNALSWQTYNSIFSKKIKIENLTKEKLHEIIFKNTVYLSKMAILYENLKIINELCTK